MNNTTGRIRTVSRKAVGDIHHEWTLIELLEDYGSAASRRWLLRCSCGTLERRFENEIGYRLAACSACSRAAKKAARMAAP